MKTKIVYVLTSDLEDYYLEMTYMSVYSARYHNPDAHIALVTDEFTMATCMEGYRKSFLEYFDEIKVVDTSEYESKVKRSRFLKTTLRNQIDGDFLYIDCDTIVCESLADIDNQKGNIALVLDCYLNKKECKDTYPDGVMEFWGLNLPVEKYFNSGVMYVKDCEKTKSFFNVWYEEWNKSQKKNVPYDQPPLCRAILKTNIQPEEMSGIWNCQMWGSFLPYFYKAKIIHISPKLVGYLFLLYDKQTICNIREKGSISPSVQEMILNVKVSFKAEGQFVRNNQYKLLNDFNNVYLLYNKSKRLFKLLNSFAELLLKIHWHTHSHPELKQ